MLPNRSIRSWMDIGWTFSEPHITHDSVQHRMVPKGLAIPLALAQQYEHFVRYARTVFTMSLGVPSDGQTIWR